MKYPKRQPTPTSDRVVIFTGGVKEDIAQVELKPGELLNCLNVEEIDGVYHGYSSLPGYERYDGQDLSSSIPITSLVDRGIDVNTKMLLESDSQDSIVDIGVESLTVINNGVINDTAHKKFLSSSFYFSGSTYFQVDDPDGNCDLGSENFTLDTLITANNPATNNILMQRGGCYSFLVDSGKLVFKYSTDGLSWTGSVTSAALIVSGNEYHVAVVREDETVSLFIDGEKDSNTLNIGTAIIKDSTDYVVIGQFFDGWMDEIRLSISARWHSDFTIPEWRYSLLDYYEYQYDDDAREAGRALILPVPGASGVLGINTNDGELVACRDNIAGTHGYFYKAEATGWSSTFTGIQTVRFENGIDTDGNYPGLVRGASVTGSISGATAVIVEIATEDGSWEDHVDHRDAAGILVLKDITGGPFVNTDVLSDAGTCTADVDDDTYIEYQMEPEGEYNFLNGKFDAFLDHQRDNVTFFANGVNYPCYLNGAEVVPIIHTNLPDNNGVYATHIVEFKNRLWLAYPDGRLWYSGVGDPYEFDVATGGAGEIYMEDEITGLQVAPGDVLVVFGRNSINMIKSIGDSDASAGTQMDYQFMNQTYSKRSGCISNTNERILGVLMFLDDRGLTELEATNKFGDFTYNSLSKNVQRTLLKQKTAVLGSLVDRVKNQYRLFFTDKTGIIFTFDQEKKVKGATFFKYNHTPTFLHDGEDADGFSHKYMGTIDGYVMKIDSGTSFDGQEIPTSISTAFFHYGTPTKWKRFRKATLEGQAEKDLIIYGRADFNYKDPRFPTSNVIEYTTTATGGIWGTDSWGAFQYGSGAAEQPSLFIQGYGINMGLVLSTSNKYTEPHIYNSIVVEYTIEGRKR